MVRCTRQEGQDGVEATIDYLSTLEDTDLIITFSVWVVKNAPLEKRAMRIFTSGLRKRCVRSCARVCVRACLALWCL